MLNKDFIIGADEMKDFIIGCDEVGLMKLDINNLALFYDKRWILRMWMWRTYQYLAW